MYIKSIYKIVAVLMLVFTMFIATSCATQKADLPQEDELKLFTQYGDIKFYIQKSSYNKIFKNLDKYAKDYSFRAKFYFIVPKGATDDLSNNLPAVEIPKETCAIEVDFSYDGKKYTIIEHKLTFFNEEGMKISERKTNNKILCYDVYPYNYLLYFFTLEYFVPQLAREYNEGKYTTEIMAPDYVVDISLTFEEKIIYMFEDNQYKYYFDRYNLAQALRALKKHEQEKGIKIDDSIKPLSLQPEYTIYYEPKTTTDIDFLKYCATVAILSFKFFD